MAATLASNTVITLTTRSNTQKDGDKKKDGQGKPGGGGKPPQKASISAVTQQQQPAGRPQRPPMSCWLGASMCREAHPLEKCEQFKKMSPEQRVVKANELHMCLTCLRHTADKECYAKGKADFKGCSEGGCGLEHHPMLHWALIVARLFQMQVVAESYPPGTQVFQLRQRIKMGKTEVGLAFDGGSNQSAITKEYTARKKLKEVGFTIPVIDFGSPEPEMGELYEVPLRTRGKWEVIIRAVAVEAIHNGPTARCPDIIATRFLQSRNAKSWNLDQAGGPIDVCLGMDYPHLQPRHLEKEFRGGQLHLYTSVFSSGLILRGVEMPEVLEAMDKPLGPAAPLQDLPKGEEAEADPPKDEEAEVDLPEDEEAEADPPKEGEEAEVDLSKGEEAKVDLPKDKEANLDLPEDEEAEVDLPEDKEAEVNLPEDEEAKADLPEDEEAEVDLPEDEEAEESLPVDEKDEKVTPPAKWRRPRGWLQAGLAMMAMLCLARQLRMVIGFVAYDCANGTNRVNAYSLLEPAACPTREDHHEVEHTIFGEIVQMKKDRTVPVFRCTVIESVMSQYCGFNSAGGVVRYITFRDPRRVEARECRATKETGKMSVGGQEFKVTPGTTISHSTFLHGDLTDRSYCETGVL